MASIRIQLAGIVSALVLSACASSPSKVFNPMPAIWRGVCEGIDDREKRHASYEEWRSDAESHERLESYQALMSALPAGYPAAGLAKSFASSSKVIKFGFEGNFHAIVFFDSNGRSWKVIKR